METRCDGPDRVAAEQSRAEIQGRLHTDAIQYQASIARAGNLLYPLGGCRGVAIVDDVVRAQRFRLLQFLVIHVRGKDTDQT